jgi:carboxymethylenebutenolidase
MALAVQDIRFGEDSAFSGYQALPPSRPQDLPLPAILLIQEAWGVDSHIRAVAQRLAAAGYAVLAPDLFARKGVRAAGLEAEALEQAKTWMETLPPGAWMDPAKRAAAIAEGGEAGKRAGATLEFLFGKALGDRDGHLQVLLAGLDYLEHGLAEARGGKRASMGFCMGGGLSAELATRVPSLSGAVVFYGGVPDRSRLAAIACPILGFYGETDTRLTAGLPAFEQGMREEGKSLELHVFKGAGHAFLNDTRSSFHPGAARLAWGRLLGFLSDCTDR